MDLAQTLGRYVPAVWTQTTAEIDAEIREELEFHLDMRTEENIRAGMSPAEARQDAQERFGDFETSRRACRKITLGPRLAFRWLQTALMVVLAGVVIYQAVLMVRMQSATQTEMEALHNTILQLQAAQRSPAVATPVVEVPHGWDRGSRSLERPWCDWEAIDEACDEPIKGFSAS